MKGKSWRGITHESLCEALSISLSFSFPLYKACKVINGGTNVNMMILYYCMVDIVSLRFPW